jgi:hypothetical protein
MFLDDTGEGAANVALTAFSKVDRQADDTRLQTLATEEAF